MIYGGTPYDRWKCGGYHRQHCNTMVGKTYMSGEFYFLSTDLSLFITSNQLDRSKVYIAKEDMATGNYVHSYPGTIVQVAVQPHHRLWEHGRHLKRPEHFEERWKLYQVEMSGGSMTLGGAWYLVRTTIDRWFWNDS